MIVLSKKEMRNVLAVISVLVLGAVITGQIVALFSWEQASLAFLLITLLPNI